MRIMIKEKWCDEKGREERESILHYEMTWQECFVRFIFFLSNGKWGNAIKVHAVWIKVKVFSALYTVYEN